MRLDFNVLWVDDQPGAVAAQIERINVLMEEEGFRFNPTQCSSLDEVEALIAGDVFQDEIDLILVDWDLGGGVHGQDVIERLRQVAQYKDVVFYSAQTPAAALRRMAFDKELEGIYCASRQDLIEEVLGVFESLVKKVLDLDHTRGIVMGATSDIDAMVNSCLSLIEAKRDDDGKKALVAEAVTRVQAQVEKIAQKGVELASATDVETILKAHMLFGANDRLRLLCSLLDDNADYAESVKRVKYYMGAVVPKRNELGHMVLTPDGKPEAVVSSEGKQINLEDMRELRKTILALREDFRTLVGMLEA